MKSLDKLRSCFDNYALLNTTTAKSVVREKADEIEKEIEERCVLLPLDKDGVPIHIGDEMADQEKDRFVVSGLDFSDTYVGVCKIIGIRYGIEYPYQPSKIVHYHKPTVEEVLEEYRVRYYDLVTDMECKNITNEEYVRGIRELATEYAAKLQLKEE